MHLVFGDQARHSYLHLDTANGTSCRVYYGEVRVQWAQQFRTCCPTKECEARSRTREASGADKEQHEWPKLAL